MWKQWQISSSWAPKSLQMVTERSISSKLWSLSGHVCLWDQDCKEGRGPKNQCLWTLVLEKTPESPWPARRSNQSILMEINPEYSLEGPMLKLKLQYFGNLMWTAYSLEKPLILWKIEGRRKRWWQRMKWLDGIIDAMDMNLNLGKLWEMMRHRVAWHAAVHGVAKNQTQRGYWKTITNIVLTYKICKSFFLLLLFVFYVFSKWKDVSYLGRCSSAFKPHVAIWVKKQSINNFKILIKLILN